MKSVVFFGCNPKTKTVNVPTFWRNSIIAFKVK
jgi:hypothetical protein